MAESNDRKALPSAPHFAVFISSPSGLDAEKTIVTEEISSLSEKERQDNAPGLTAMAWPDGIAAGVASYGQSVINRQTSQYDILVCIVGSRMGTPTPRANSGTEEEFDRAIEAMLSGTPLQILLFFSNMMLRPQCLDPHQLLLVRAFREKATRLGVLYHMFDSHEELRHLVRISLNEAYQFLCGFSGVSRYRPQTASLIAAAQPRVIRLSNVTLRNRTSAPQWADAFLVPLAEYRRQNIRLTWTMATSSPYFRFGFKFYDSREPLFSAGSVQTVGQNILLHVGKNCENPTWFATVYRASYRLGPDLPLPETTHCVAAHFAIDITSSGSVMFCLGEKPILDLFFPIDGIPNLALLAWGDEHEFQCDLSDLVLHIHVRTEVNP